MRERVHASHGYQATLWGILDLFLDVLQQALIQGDLAIHEIALVNLGGDVSDIGLQLYTGKLLNRKSLIAVIF